MNYMTQKLISAVYLTLTVTACNEDESQPIVYQSGPNNVFIRFPKSGRIARLMFDSSSISDLDILDTSQKNPFIHSGVSFDDSTGRITYMQNRTGLIIHAYYFAKGGMLERCDTSVVDSTYPVTTKLIEFKLRR